MNWWKLGAVLSTVACVSSVMNDKELLAILNAGCAVFNILMAIESIVKERDYDI